MSDVRAAAERLRRLARPGFAGNTCDIELVVNAYLREHDETPVDAEWLKSVGFEANGFGVLDFYPWGFLGWRISWSPHESPWEGEVVVNSDRWPKPLKTRGDLHRLCSALGINLKG